MQMMMMMMMKRNKVEVVGADHNTKSSMSGCSTGDHHHVDDHEVRRGPWTLEEDSLLTNYIVRHGEGRWNMLAKCAGLKRTGKSCRLRWLNYLKPDIKRGNLTSQEQLLILQLHSKWGNRWSKIAQHLPGRTDNEIKNYWRTRVQKQARLLNIHTSSTATPHDTTFLELAAVRSSLWTPTCSFQHFHKIQQTSSSSSSSSFNTTTTTPTDHGHFDHSLPTNIIPNPTKPVIYNSTPPPLMPNLAPSPSISTTHQSHLQPAANLHHHFPDQVQFLIPQSSWSDQGVGHPTANISYMNYNLDQSCCNNSINNYGYDDDHEILLGNCTMASTSALQPYFNPNSTHDDQCHDMEIRADLAYADVANTLWNMDDIWQIRDQELNTDGI